MRFFVTQLASLLCVLQVYADFVPPVHDFPATIQQNGPPPPNGGGGGGGGASPTGAISGTSSVSDTTCTNMGTSCSKDGSSNYYSSQLTYNPSTGKFSGYMITNKCPNYASANPSTGGCVKQTFPDAAFTTAPKQAPLLGATGYSKHGVFIYGAFDAGFTAGQVCTSGTCDGGTDIDICGKLLDYSCTSSINQNMLMDSCGGHASPYHYHLDLACEYDSTSKNSHSPMVGIMLDGIPLYGMWEGNGKAPDLDACNGHLGPVPSDSTPGMSVTAGNVYHYHTSKSAPFTPNCYGPVASITTCRGLFQTCTSSCSSLKTKTGTYQYNLFCPCFDTSRGGSNCLSQNWADVSASSTAAASKSASAAQKRTDFSVSLILLSLLVAVGIFQGSYWCVDL